MTLPFHYSFNQNRAWLTFSALISLLFPSLVQANPTGGSVAQGAATFNNSGSRLTINQSSANAFINWSSFNIGRGETTSFIQPSSSSVVWNQINDANPSQILGTLNANGFVVLQNQNGFYVGGSGSLNTHGLVMTTARCAMPDLSSGGAWSFNTPPPAAKIVNYGQINVAGGNPAFLIASDIANNGTISAPGGKIGLYAGQTVLVSTSPDGRGLSARVTLPQGSVDNEGKLIADAGSIVAQAKTVNQNGLVQANSVQSVNGVIELLASDSLNLGANSVISAKGDSTGISSGGTVTLKSDNAYSDQLGSVIDISGGAQGGNGGMLEISAPQMDSIQSAINGQASPGYLNGLFTLDPYNILLTSASSDPNAAYGGTVVASDPPIGVGSTLTLDVTKFASTLSQINLQALNNITLGTLWTLGDSLTPAQLSMTAGNNITLNDGTGIQAGRNWNLSLTAGTALPSGSVPSSGNSGIYLNGSSSLQTQSGNINLWAAHEIQVGWSGSGSAAVNAGTGSIDTLGGGSINAVAQFGDVNAGSNPNGFIYKKTAPFYSVSPSLGGISTAAGGDVAITAGGNVISLLPSGPTVGADSGTGAFGANPGNVTINAGNNVYGHYVLANGVGTINAGHDVGTPSGGNSFALSLIKGSWNVNAPSGYIYLQEVRNPNGVFNNLTDPLHHTLAGSHLFNYDPSASVSLAAVGVDLTDLNLPRLTVDAVPVIYPPILNIAAGSGGVVMQDNVTLYPSPNQNLNIVTTGGGNMVSAPNTANTIPELLMSDSSQTRWVSSSDPTTGSFGDKDHSTALPIQSASANPAVVNISGNVENLTFITSKETQFSVGGNMNNCGFSGQNLNSGDVTFINVGGQIYNRGSYSFVYLNQPIPNLPALDLLPGMGYSWNNIFTLALNPTAISTYTLPVNTPIYNWAASAIENCSLFPVQVQRDGSLTGINPGFVYNSTINRLGFGGQMPQSVAALLSKPSYTVLHLVNGLPVLDAHGHFMTDTVSWVDPAQVSALYNASLGAPSPISGQLGYRIGGPGQFNINAGSISLGNSYGILSCGVADPQGGYSRYANLASVTESGGATINVTTAGNLDMLTSTIAAIGGGDVNVISTAGSMDLGSQELFITQRQVGLGIFTSGKGNVNLTALGNIDINGSRVAAFNGGNISIESLEGDVNAGSGGASFNGVGVSFVDPVTKKAGFYAENVYGSGILANTLVDPSQVPGSASQPGDITVTTPKGSIYASLGGILQEALNGNVGSGPVITLSAGTFPSGSSAGYPGDIDLGDSGVIGGTVNIKANGNIKGLIVSRQNSNVQASKSVLVTLLAGGSAGVSGQSVAGEIIGVGGASVSGSVTAQVLSQNSSVNGGSSQSTLGSASASSASQSAANQSSSDTKKYFAINHNGEDDDDKKKKGKPVLQRIKRVTVLLPKAS